MYVSGRKGVKVHITQSANLENMELQGVVPEDIHEGLSITYNDIFWSCDPVKL